MINTKLRNEENKLLITKPPPLFFFNALILRTLFSYKNKRKQHNLVLLIVKSLIDSFLAQRLVRCPGSSSLVVRGGWCNPNPQTILEDDTSVFLSVKFTINAVVLGVVVVVIIIVLLMCGGTVCVCECW